MLREDVLLDKNQVLDSFKDLPEQVSSEELIERILFIKLIQERLRELEEVSNEVVMENLQELRRQKLATVNASA